MIIIANLIYTGSTLFEDFIFELIFKVSSNIHLRSISDNIETLIIVLYTLRIVEYFLNLIYKRYKNGHL